MIELAKHIEVLLLENDCVIVPGLGGFIAHHHSSAFNKETGEFLPPMRSIGFNPQLIMNDGLLVQSYMQAYNTDFPDATRKIEKIVEQLKDDLYKRGQVSLNRLGTLYYNMNGSYEFEPTSSRFFTPSLYGLENVVLPRLETRRVQETAEAPRRPRVIPMHTEPPRRKRAGMRWIGNAVAVAAAILMFFLMSTPVENTYVDNMEYASLGSTTLFDIIRNESAASYVAGSKAVQPQSQTIKNNVNTLKPVRVKTEKIAANAYPAQPGNVQAKAGTPAASQTAAPKKAADNKAAETKNVKKNGSPAAKTVQAQKAFIIVSSLATRKDAEDEVKKLAGKGFKGAQILESNGRFRIALEQFTQKSDAYERIKILKQNEDFKSAWVFVSK